MKLFNQCEDSSPVCYVFSFSASLFDRWPGLNVIISIMRLL